MIVGHGAGDGKIRVRISAWDTLGVMGVWIYQYRGSDVLFAYPKDGSLVFEKKGETGFMLTPPPTFAIPMEFAADFRKAMAAALVDWGQENQSESKIAGKLEAAMAHLADMRTLVFTGPNHASSLIEAKEKEIGWLRDELAIMQARIERVNEENLKLQGEFRARVRK